MTIANIEAAIQSDITAATIKAELMAERYFHGEDPADLQASQEAATLAANLQAKLEKIKAIVAS